MRHILSQYQRDFILISIIIINIIILQKMQLKLLNIFLCQLCIWLGDSAPSLSKLEGVISADESVQSLTNSIGNSIYTSVGSASPSVHTTGNNLVVKTKGGQSDVTRVSGTGSEDFAVTNTITSKDTGKNSFDQTSPSFNEIQPTSKAMKTISKKSIKSKKSGKGKFLKSENNQVAASDNTLQEKYTTTPMSPVLVSTQDPFSDGFDFFTTTTEMSVVTDLQFFSSSPDPVGSEGNGPPTTTFTRKLFSKYFLLTR